MSKTYKPPAFQLYADRWLGSTKIALMSPSAEGAYIRLLCHAWNDPQTSIPSDPEILAQLSRLGKTRWKRVCTSILICFEPHPKLDGRIHNPKLTAIKKELERFHKSKSRQGKKGAAARWHGHSPGNGPAIRSPLANDDSTSTTTTTSTTTKKQQNTSGYPPDFLAFWNVWPKHFRKGKKGNALKAWKAEKKNGTWPGDNAVLSAVASTVVAKAKGSDSQFLSFPGVWIRAHGWDDAPAERTKPKPQPIDIRPKNRELWCPDCEGYGKSENGKCRTCDGSGVDKSKTVSQKTIDEYKKELNR